MAVKSAEYSALKKAIAANKLCSLYILHGTESYLREYYLGEMKKVVLSGSLDDMNMHRLEGKSLEIAELREAVDALPVFSQRSFVEVRDFDVYKLNEEKSKELIEILSDIPEYCCLVFVYDLIEFKADKRRKIHSVIEKNAHIVDVPLQDHSDLVNWIRRRFAASSADISSQDAQYMIYYCGSLMTALISEIDKLSAYCAGRNVTKADIDRIAIPITEVTAFSIVDAISKRKYAKAAELMSRLFEMRESPIMLLSIIGSQIRKTYAARLVFEQNGNAGSLKELLGLRTDYQARSLMETARAVSLGWCEKALELCYDCDLKMKSSSLGDEELLIALLLQLTEGEA